MKAISDEELICSQCKRVVGRREERGDDMNNNNNNSIYSMNSMNSFSSKNSNSIFDGNNRINNNNSINNYKLYYSDTEKMIPGCQDNLMLCFRNIERLFL